MKHVIARLVDAAMNRYAPIVHARTYHAFTTDETVGGDWLTTRETDNEVFEPDELWAAMQRHPVGKKQRDRADLEQPADAGAIPGIDGSQSPAGVGARVEAYPPRAAAASATGAGGSATEADIKVVASRVLRDCGVEYPSATTDVLVRELLLHFDFHHKK